MIVDIAVLALTLWAEARGESAEGKYAIADVIYNRKTSSGLSWRGVCLQNSQFSCWNDNNAYHLLVMEIADINPWLECLEISNKLVDGIYIAKHPWTHYYNPDLCHPSWGDKMTNVCIIGKHKFGTL